MKKITITVDGKELEAYEGETILAALKRAGLDSTVPTLCYEPGLEPYTSCFVCVVEVEGVGRLMPACSTPVKDGMVIKTDSERVRNARKTALELLLSNHPADCDPPCSRGCPAGVDVQTYLALAKHGHFLDAVKIIRQKNPLPVVCGRVCVRKCEESCRRAILDEPVGINLVKRAVSEWWIKHPYEEKPGPDTGKRVAIVGGGPAGLTAAYYLRLLGHAVTLFEMHDKLGGMLRWGIPNYRLPEYLLDFEIEQILKLGVETKLNHKLGRDFTLSDLMKKYDAVFVAIGAQKGASARMEVKEHPNILTGIDFLFSVKRGTAPNLEGKRVVVVGGGNTAIDAARTAVRLGADCVTILYRRTRKEMPAHEEEIIAAEQEGVRIEYLVAPVRAVIEDGEFKGAICVKMRLGEPDASGRRRPIPIPDSEHMVTCDYLITAIGQKVEFECLKDDTIDIETTKWGIVVDPASMATNVEGVFAGGDAVSGPATVIEAIAAGRKAAFAIDQYLTIGKVIATKQFCSKKEDFGPVTAGDLPSAEAIPRNKPAMLPAKDRVHSFAEVEQTLGVNQVKKEASRCLQCGCPARSDCSLRKLAQEYGVESTSFGYAVKHRIDDSHPEIVLDPNRCILCTKCMRICGDLMGVSVLGLVNRGFETVLAPSMGKKLAETECISCGNCVDACPTGALSFKRPSFSYPALTTQKTICTFCGEMCEVVMGRNQWGYSVKNAKDEQGIRQLICKYGRFGLIEVVSGERLTTAYVRSNGRLLPVSVVEAVKTAVEGLEKVLGENGPSSILFAASPELTVEEMMLFKKLASEGFGADTTSLSVVATDAEVYGLDNIYGITRSTATYNDMQEASLVVVVGCDPTETNPVVAAKFRRAVRAGAKIAAITSSPTKIKELADTWLEARRGSISYILAWLLQRVIAQHPKLAEKLKNQYKVIKNLTLEQVVAATGVDKAELLHLADLLVANDGKVVFVYTIDDKVDRSPGAITVLGELVESLSCVNRSCGILLCSQIPNWQALRFTGLLPSESSKFNEVLDKLYTGMYRAAWIVRENPQEDEMFSEVLANMEFMVVQETYMTSTATGADVILPASTHLETGGTFVLADGRTLYVASAADKVVEASNLEIFKMAGRIAGLQKMEVTVKQVSNAVSEHKPKAKFNEVEVVVPMCKVYEWRPNRVLSARQLVRKKLLRLANSTVYE